MQKARVVEPKTQRCFIDSRETMWGSHSGGHGLIDLKCCKFSALLWWLSPGLEGSSRPLYQHHHLDQPLSERCMNFT